jgi:hypothetical protein
MKVYITYDRYENDEWYNIYYVSTNERESIKHCLEKDLVDFISYGPDDCHSFQLQEVEMTKKQYDQFTKWIEEDQSLEDYGSKSSDLYNFMVELYDCTGVVDDTNTIISTDGCTDCVDVVHYYGNQLGLDTEDDEVYYEVQEKLYEDDELFDKILKEYIYYTY